MIEKQYIMFLCYRRGTTTMVSREERTLRNEGGKYEIGGLEGN
jgi:hypothetical protein